MLYKALAHTIRAKEDATLLVPQGNGNMPLKGNVFCLPTLRSM
jgi:hypothetical protein